VAKRDNNKREKKRTKEKEEQTGYDEKSIPSIHVKGELYLNQFC
jgi:hypothetical protein